MDVIDTYQEIKCIKVKDYKKISLVQSSIDNLFYIKRELLYYDKEVYLQLQQLNSIHIPNIFHIKEKDGWLIIIEEYINSLTLDSYIANNEIDENQAVQIIQQLCDCLYVLHSLKNPIIHRDIKPENIFNDHGRIILFDFDIARVYNQSKNKDTIVLGSVGYAAPEQFGFGQSDARSDIYALGVLFNVLLTKQLPQENLYNGKYKKIIMKATSVDRKNRYSSIEEIKRVLQDKRLIIPGINNITKKQKIWSMVGYIVIIAISMSMKISKTSFNYPAIVYIGSTLYMVGLEFVICNQHLCLFHKKNIIIRILGVILTYFLFLMIVTILLQFVDSMLWAYQIPFLSKYT